MRERIFYCDSLLGVEGLHGAGELSRELGTDTEAVQYSRVSELGSRLRVGSRWGTAEQMVCVSGMGVRGYSRATDAL